MKILFDFLPIFLFFLTFNQAKGHEAAIAQWLSQSLGFMIAGGTVAEKEAPIMLATLVVILATLSQVIYLKLRRQKVDTMLWVSLGLVTVMGGATIYFHDETFIKWKPSVLYWVMALSFWLSPILTGKNLLKMMMGEQLELPEKVWRNLNLSWTVFFGFMGGLNLWVAYHYDLDTWVSFKSFWSMGLMAVFMVGQGVYLSRHVSTPDQDTDAPR